MQSGFKNTAIAHENKLQATSFSGYMEVQPIPIVTM